MPADDGELVRRTLEGDWEAFSALVDRYRDAVCGVAYHHLGDFEEAQDAYRVATREGAAWCLEHHAFAYGAGAADRPQS